MQFSRKSRFIFLKTNSDILRTCIKNGGISEMLPLWKGDNKKNLQDLDFFTEIFKMKVTAIAVLFCLVGSAFFFLLQYLSKKQF